MAENKPKPMVIYGGPLFDGENEVYEDGAIFFADGKIISVGNEETVFSAMPRDVEIETYDTRGKVIFPGLINTHHHFYSAFARGLAPLKPIHNFKECLKHLWWQLDQALDPESIQLSTLISLLDSIRHGVTTIFDHHSSPKSIKGSLTNIAAVVERAGIKACLCYEISDRNGKTAFQQGLTENLNFIAAHRQHPTIRGMLGLHANFTLSEESLQEIAQHFDSSVGIHIHCAEDLSDVQFCQNLGYAGPVSRLYHFDLLSPHTILAHGVHLSDGEWQIAADTHCSVIHNPESNMNNNVGRLPLPLNITPLMGLGTDGMTSNMLQTLRAGFLLHRQAGVSAEILLQLLPDILFRQNAQIARRFFDSAIGHLIVGAPADIVVFDHIPYTTFNRANLAAHLVYGMAESRATLVIADGKCIYEDGVFLTLDEELILEESQKASQRLWQQFGKAK